MLRIGKNCPKERVYSRLVVGRVPEKMAFTDYSSKILKKKWKEILSLSLTCIW